MSESSARPASGTGRLMAQQIPVLLADDLTAVTGERAARAGLSGTGPGIGRPAGMPGAARRHAGSLHGCRPARRQAARTGMDAGHQLAG